MKYAGEIVKHKVCPLCDLEHDSKEALRTHFGEPVYHPSDLERRQLIEGLEASDLAATRDWDDVRRQLRSRS